MAVKVDINAATHVSAWAKSVGNRASTASKSLEKRASSWVGALSKDGAVAGVAAEISGA